MRTQQRKQASDVLKTRGSWLRLELSMSSAPSLVMSLSVQPFLSVDG